MSLSPVIDRKKWTEAELQALPDDGFNYEVVNGELVMSPKNSPKHGQICARHHPRRNSGASQRLFRERDEAGVDHRSRIEIGGDLLLIGGAKIGRAEWGTEWRGCCAGISV